MSSQMAIFLFFMSEEYSIPCMYYNFFIHSSIYLFFGCAGSLLLCGLFSSCDEWGLLFNCSVLASYCVPSLIAEHGLQGTWTSVVAAHGLNSWGS